MDICECAVVGAGIEEVACSPVSDGEGLVVGDRDNSRIRAKDKDVHYFFMATGRDFIWSMGTTRLKTPVKERVFAYM